MSVCILALFTWQAECIFSVQHCIIMYGLSGYTIFYHTSGTTFRKVYGTQNECFDFLYIFCLKRFSFYENVINVHRPSRKVPHYSCPILMKPEFSPQIFKKSSIHQIS